MGAQSNVQRSFSGAKEQVRTVLTLVPFPVEGCPVEGCTPPIPALSPDCSLRFSRGLAAGPLGFLHFFGPRSFTEVLATSAPTLPFPAYSTLEMVPDLDFSNSRQSLYTGTTAEPGSFPPCRIGEDAWVLPNAAWCPASRLSTLDGNQTGSDSPVRARASPAKRAMNDKSRQNGQRTPEEDFSEFGEVRVISRPAPDAEDRLRRLFTILLKPSARDGQTASAKDAPPDHERTGDYLDAEA